METTSLGSNKFENRVKYHFIVKVLISNCICFFCYCMSTRCLYSFGSKEYRSSSN